MQMNVQHNQNLWDAAKAVLREKVLALSAYIGHEKSLQPMTLASNLRN